MTVRYPSRDQYNTTTFKPIKAEGLRIEAVAQKGFSSGVLEWRAE